MIAYSHCIAHGIEMRPGLDQQCRAVASGHWPLMRYDPMVRATAPSLLSRTVGGVRQLADAGLGAVVLYSLFEEQIRREAEQNALLAAQGTETYAESPVTISAADRGR